MMNLSHEGWVCDINLPVFWKFAVFLILFSYLELENKTEGILFEFLWMFKAVTKFEMPDP